MEMRFDNKVVLVTGASSGIGRAVAEAFGAAGAKVAVNYRRHRESAEQSVQKIQAAGGAAIAVEADVTQTAAVTKMVATVTETLGPVEILINNAGAAVELCRLVDMSEDLWDRILGVNLRSAFLCTRAVLPAMLQRKAGVIVNISSVAARLGGGPGEVAYTTAKGALNSFTHGLAKELAKDGIRANTVSPGATRTNFHEGIFEPGKLDSLAPRIPLGRIGVPEDLVGAVLLLASDAGSYITGQTLEVNGGLWVG